MSSGVPPTAACLPPPPGLPHATPPIVALDSEQASAVIPAETHPMCTTLTCWQTPEQDRNSISSLRHCAVVQPLFACLPPRPGLLHGTLVLVAVRINVQAPALLHADLKTVLYWARLLITLPSGMHP